MNTDKKNLWISDETSNLDAGFAEVEQQTQRQPCSLEIVDALGIVGVFQRFDCLQFDHNGLLDEQINRILPYYDGVIVHNNPVLLHYHQSSLAQFMGERVFINLLQKPGTQCIADPKCAPYDALRYPIYPKCICVHLCSSVVDDTCGAPFATGANKTAPICTTNR